MKLIRNVKSSALRAFRNLRHKYSENVKLSYSQCGEDLIVQQLFTVLGIGEISYLDVGAHHPTFLSNTYLFYQNGGKGVCVEPDPSLFKEFDKKRPRDRHLNCGVGLTQGRAKFYVMSSSTLNTFSESEAKRYQSYGNQQILETVELDLKPINQILDECFEKTPNFISLDIEGLDYPVLNSLDFNKYRPEVFCLETLTYTENKTEQKLTNVIELMHENGYLTYADTYINTIFVDAFAWENRR